MHEACENTCKKLCGVLGIMIHRTIQQFHSKTGWYAFNHELIGRIGTLMAESGLSDVMECVFDGVGHKLAMIRRIPKRRPMSISLTSYSSLQRRMHFRSIQ
jgi:hypothetical protein